MEDFNIRTFGITLLLSAIGAVAVFCMISSINSQTDLKVKASVLLFFVFAASYPVSVLLRNCEKNLGAWIRHEN